MTRKLPERNTSVVEVPEVTNNEVEIPEANKVIKPDPPVGHIENIITIDGDSIEIFPTKMQYHRDRTALFYHVLDYYPLPDILSADKGYFDPERDGDKCLFDFLIAVFDNEKYVKKHYNNMRSDHIEKILEIYKRLNNITEKEEQSKNRQAKGTKT